MNYVSNARTTWWYVLSSGSTKKFEDFCPPIQIVISYRAFSIVTTPVFLFLLMDNCSIGFYLQSPISKK
jgi:hypothetical protein